jgi:hypothetical protein
MADTEALADTLDELSAVLDSSPAVAKDRARSKRPRPSKPQRKASASPSRPKDSSGALKALRHLQRAARVGPSVFKGLKELEQAQQVAELAQRLRAAGLSFRGSHPTKSDISKARSAADIRAELDGINAANVIASPEVRRARVGDEPAADEFAVAAKRLEAAKARYVAATAASTDGSRGAALAVFDDEEDADDSTSKRATPAAAQHPSTHPPAQEPADDDDHDDGNDDDSSEEYSDDSGSE